MTARENLYALKRDVTALLKDVVWSIFQGHGLKEHEWTVQGFGMVRTYLDEEKTWRLNVYHSSLIVPDVSIVHTHPWHFDSWILGGVLTNHRHVIVNNGEDSTFRKSGDQHMLYAEIKTGIKSNVGNAGEGGVMPQGDCWLRIDETEQFEPSDNYHMEADEIHHVEYTDGCVTLNRRVRVGDGEHAIVYWPYGQEWVSAKPRLATEEEIEAVISAGIKAMKREANG